MLARLAYCVAGDALGLGWDGWDRFALWWHGREAYDEQVRFRE